MQDQNKTYWKVSVARNNKVLGDRIQFARSYASRLIGLLNRSRLDAGEGLILHPCNAIHMIGMRFAIDVLFVNASWDVVTWQENIQPWRVSPVVRQACAVIELPAGTIRASEIVEGDRLLIS